MPPRCILSRSKFGIITLYVASAMQAAAFAVGRTFYRESSEKILQLHVPHGVDSQFASQDYVCSVCEHVKGHMYDAILIICLKAKQKNSCSLNFKRYAAGGMSSVCRQINFIDTSAPLCVLTVGLDFLPIPITAVKFIP